MRNNNNNPDAAAANTTPSIQEYYQNIPFGTFISFIICIALQIGIYIFGLQLGRYTILPIAVIYQYEWHRIITSAFFHNGLIHIGFNMLSLLTLGPAVEKIVGTFRFILYIFLCIILSNILYVFVCYLLAIILKNPSWLLYNSVGYSGILFAFATIESFLSLSPTRNFFGCAVPSKYYPFVMLIGIQIMMPNISFLGHLCGLFIGALYVFGMLEWCLPTRVYVQTVEETYQQQQNDGNGNNILNIWMRHRRYYSSPKDDYLLKPPQCIENCFHKIGNICNNSWSFLMEQGGRSAQSVVSSIGRISSSNNNSDDGSNIGGRSRRRRRRNRNGYSSVSTLDVDTEDDDLDGDNEEDGGISSGDDEDDNEESGVGVVESKV